MVLGGVSDGDGGDEWYCSATAMWWVNEKGVMELFGWKESRTICCSSAVTGRDLVCYFVYVRLSDCVSPGVFVRP